MGTPKALCYSDYFLFDTAFSTPAQKRAAIDEAEYSEIVEKEAFKIASDYSFIDLFFKQEKVCGTERRYGISLVSQNLSDEKKNSNNLLSEVGIKILSDVSFALSAICFIFCIILFVNSSYLYLIPTGFSVFGFLLFGFISNKVVRVHLTANDNANFANGDGIIGSVK